MKTDKETIEMIINTIQESCIIEDGNKNKLII